MPDKQNVFVENGLFWIGNHGNDDRTFVAGELRLEKSGISYLNLIGVLIDGGAAVFNQEQPLDEIVIYGTLTGRNGFVILNRVRRNGGTMVSDGYGVSAERFVAYDCLLFSSENDFDNNLNYDDLTVDLTEFGEWFGYSGVRVDFDSDNKYVVSVVMPEPNVYHIDGGCLNVTHKEISSGHKFTHDTRSISIKQISLLNWKSNTVLSLEKQRENFQHIEEVLSLLTGIFHQLPWPILKNSKGNVCTYYFARQIVFCKPIKQFDCWTAWNRLKNDFGKIFENLLEVREKFGPGLYLYLSTKQANGIFSENKFMNLIWGLESLHRRSSEGEVVVNELQEKIQRILAKIDNNKDKRWLAGKLKNAGEPSLGERLDSLFREIPIKLDSKGLRSFADECAKLRNDISHFGGLRDKSDKYSDFINRLNLIMEIMPDMYHALLLHRIGLDEFLINYHFYQSPKSCQYRKIFQKLNILPEDMNLPDDFVNCRNISGEN